MRYLTLGEVLALHRRILAESGGRPGLRDLGAIASALSQPRVSVGGQDAHPTLMDEAAALGYSLIRNHGFIDGNERIAHAAIEVFLIMNGMELRASVDDQERFMLALAAGFCSAPTTSSDELSADAHPSPRSNSHDYAPRLCCPLCECRSAGAVRAKSSSTAQGFPRWRSQSCRATKLLHGRVACRHEGAGLRRGG